MPRLSKIDSLLSPEHLAEFQTLALDGTVTVDRLKLWVRQRGYPIGRTAVHRWQQSFRRLSADPVHQLRSYIVARVERMTAEQLAALCEHVNAL